MNLIPDRDLRQRDIVPPERLAACRATVIGVGAIGRQAAIQLAAIGMPHLTLIDFDTVESVNLAPQGYFPADLGSPKVDATAQLVRQINPEIHVEAVRERFRRSTEDYGNVLFVCVDSIETRKLMDAFLSRTDVPITVSKPPVEPFVELLFRQNLGLSKI